MASTQYSYCVANATVVAEKLSSPSLTLKMMWPKTFIQFSSLLFEHNVQRRFEEIVNNVIRKMMFIIIEIKYFSVPSSTGSSVVESVWNVMTYAQKPDFVFRRNGWVYLNRRGRQFSRLLAADVCASAVLMLDTPRSEVVWRVLATRSIRQFPLHFPSRVSPCAIRFQTHASLHSA